MVKHIYFRIPLSAWTTVSRDVEKVWSRYLSKLIRYYHRHGVSSFSGCPATLISRMAQSRHPIFLLKTTPEIQEVGKKKGQRIKDELIVFNRITSYINNLHPEKYKPLYAIIEQIIDKTIPLWNATLTPLKREGQQVRIPYPDVVYDIPEDNRPTRLPNEDEYYFEQRCRDSVSEKLGDYLVQPQPVGKFEPPRDNNEEMLVDLRRDYGQSGLQVIVKLANIHLTPENPRYLGGSWHVEGQLNERICASAIYYYSAENITDNYPSFQQHLLAEVDIPYDQNRREWLEGIFGCEDEGPTLQNIGHVLTRQGRLLTFPNTLLHLVEPFRLADPSRPGHRKILALFLVDPNIHILSTAHIPCQQREWWAESVRSNTNGSKNYHGKLPNEIWEMILDMVEGFPLTLEEAKVLRQELMDERTEYNEYHVHTIEPFSLCEH